LRRLTRRPATLRSALNAAPKETSLKMMCSDMEGRESMKHKASISHDEAIVRRLRKNPRFTAEYLKAVLEDEDEPRVLLIALGHLARAFGLVAPTIFRGWRRQNASDRQD
jgi:hypothetical protein